MVIFSLYCCLLCLGPLCLPTWWRTRRHFLSGLSSSLKSCVVDLMRPGSTTCINLFNLKRNCYIVCIIACSTRDTCICPHGTEKHVILCHRSLKFVEAMSGGPRATRQRGLHKSFKFNLQFLFWCAWAKWDLDMQFDRGIMTLHPYRYYIYI